jgi:hypothetical protein
VASAITKHFKETDNAGQIVFATHAVLSYVRFWRTNVIGTSS